MSTDRVIGSGEGMPWDVPEEYAQFLRFIAGMISDEVVHCAARGKRTARVPIESLTSDQCRLK
jgi:hypothetical protein